MDWSDKEKDAFAQAANGSAGMVRDVETPETDDSDSSKPVDDYPADFPEGGLRAWLTVAGAWLVIFATFGFLNAFGVFQDYYSRFYLRHYSPSAIIWIGSIQFCLQFCLGIVVGPLFDAGYFHHLVIGGSALYVFSLFMLSLARPGAYYQVLLSQGVGAGLGVGLSFLPTVSVLSLHFAKRRGVANGIIFSGSSVAGIGFPILLNHLLHSGKVGFGNATRIGAGIIALASLAGNALMRTRTHAIRRPAATGGHPVARPNPVEFFKEPAFVAVLVGLFCATIAIFFPLFYLQVSAITHGVDHSLAFDLLTILNAASVPGRLLPNFAADRWGTLNVMLVASVACTALIVSMLGIRGPAGAPVAVIAALYGFTSGAFISLISPAVAATTPDVRQIGVRTGVMFLFMGFAALAGNPISGALLTGEYVWWRPIVFNAVLLGTATVALVFARSILTRQKGTWRV